jgi:hypothetical protein
LLNLGSKCWPIFEFGSHKRSRGVSVLPTLFETLASHRCLRSHLRAHVDLFLELNLLRSTIVHNNAIQRAAPSSPPKKCHFVCCISRQNLCVFIKISCIVYTQTWIQVFLIQVFLNGDLDAKLVSCIPGFTEINNRRIRTTIKLHDFIVHSTFSPKIAKMFLVLYSF